MGKKKENSSSEYSGSSSESCTYSDKLKRKVGTRKTKEQLSLNRIPCPECIKMSTHNPKHKVQDYASISSLYTHVKIIHDIIIPCSELKKLITNGLSVSKKRSGRPKNKIQINSEDEDNLENIDEQDQKLKILYFYEDDNFTGLLQNLMFTNGYLSRNFSQRQTKPLKRDGILNIFKSLAQQFQFEIETFSQQFLEYLEFLSELVNDESFIILFFAIYGFEIEQLFKFCDENKNNNQLYKDLYDIINQETLTYESKNDFKNYYNELRIYTNILQYNYDKY